MFEWMEKNADLVFFCSLSLKLFALNRERRTCGKTIWQVFFVAPAAPKKVLKLAGFAQLHAVRTGWFFFAENDAHKYFPPKKYFLRKRTCMHGQEDVFVFLSSLSSAAALSENGSARGGGGGSDAYKRAIRLRRRISRAS